ncbi:MAG TPA: aminotransferase class I/II-fold pyridoxal phosphate-dependent enzyme [Terriglobales bacterium]|nr:aminotransferase class I/II-fold pyridoxal phosphate-dependent enzyme [Terriglobales bacterium]
MGFTRRNFLSRLAIGAGSAAVLQVPLAQRIFASPEPQRTLPLAGAIQLGSNENAYGPLPSAVSAMQDALSRANRYPFVLYGPLVERIAAYHRISPEQVVIGSGSTEPMRLSAQALVGTGKNVVVADPTFEAMGEFASELRAEIRKVPLSSSFAHDLDAMLKRVDANTAVVYICNPNNPTASVTPAGDLETFFGKLPAHVTVVMDEAYHHFADGMPGYRSFIDRAGDRFIVLRTFSKIYGMAGMRLGYSVSSAATAKKLSEYSLPISINIVAAAAGMASLDDDVAMKFAAERNAADRAEFMAQAAARKLAVIPSSCNFAMVKTGRPAKDLNAAFRARNIIVGRPFPPMLDYLRVSFGQPAEMKTFWQAWDQINS